MNLQQPLDYFTLEWAALIPSVFDAEVKPELRRRMLAEFARSGEPDEIVGVEPDFVDPRECAITFHTAKGRSYRIQFAIAASGPTH